MPVSAHELKRRVFEPLSFIVEGLIPTGLAVLAGSPKVGKSWLSLDIALSTARGVGCLGERSCTKGAVLYLALEDSDRRLQSRLERMLGMGPVWPRNLYFETVWPRVDEGGLERLRHWVETTADARLIVIDVFEKFRSLSGRSGGYQSEYAALSPLFELAREAGIGIVLVHHLRKSGGDAFDRITGSAGFVGVPDTILVLDKGRGGTRLLARGRDIEETVLDVAFDMQSMSWRVVQPRAALSAYPERDRVQSLLAESGVPLTPLDIAQRLEQSPTAIRALLSRMYRGGEIEKVGLGRYVSRRRHDDAA